MVEIVPMKDCASNYGVFVVPSSKPGKSYQVVLGGSEGAPYCDCEAFKFSGKERTCKHVALVYAQACLYNPQWRSSKENPGIRPDSYTYDRFVEGEACACGGPLVYVRRAV